MLESPTISTVCSRSPEALLSFTTSTATSVLPCTGKKDNTSKRKSMQRLSSMSTVYARPLPPLTTFIANLFQRSQLPPSVCLVSLIYLQRIKRALSPLARGDHDTPYRLFIAAIVSASKFMLEPRQALTSQDVAGMIDHVYTPKEINSMERSFLGLIKFDLFVDIHAIKDYLAMHGTLLEMDLVEQQVAAFDEKHQQQHTPLPVELL
ncbi:cyclin domain-containing protein [Lichtheimia corymbifera JMRC:FSU:9682]|uniref:Cyclin domain-containing protein n=1 Tax=Lichtheimia corymbifera JMRC:FSU:9682 TaxID=1263082 RepID=A0A068RN23_9FUNG|nr:cyclin domain-containing protein [Lichtheimia corymbifera JMRC:FSU:9682]